MSKVYFLKAPENNTPERMSAAAAALFKTFLDQEKINLARKLPLKVHFGEKGNETFIPPACFNGLIDLLKSHNIDPCYTETNALYRGERQNRASHEKLAAAHGFDQLPVIIADGDYGNDFKQVKINKKALRYLLYRQVHCRSRTAFGYFPLQRSHSGGIRRGRKTAGHGVRCPWWETGTAS